MKIALALLLSIGAWQDDGGVKDRADFIPDPEKPAPVNAGKHVMVLVAEAGPIIGPNLQRVGINTLVLSGAGGGYRWCYLGTPEKRGPLATYDNTLDFGVTRPYSLVEVDVQEGRGSPDGKPPLFAASIKVLDGSTDFPLHAHKVVAEARTRYDAWLKEKEKDVPAAMEKARQDAGGDGKKARPARSATLMFVTWLENPQKLQVRFLTRYESTDDVMKPGPNTGGLPKPPHLDYWGVDFGLIFEAGKTGTIEKRLALPMETWKGTPPRPLVDWRDFPAARDRK